MIKKTVDNVHHYIHQLHYKKTLHVHKAIRICLYKHYFCVFIDSAYGWLKSD